MRIASIVIIMFFLGGKLLAQALFEEFVIKPLIWVSPEAFLLRLSDFPIKILRKECTGVSSHKIATARLVLSWGRRRSAIDFYLLPFKLACCLSFSSFSAIENYFLRSYLIDNI